jgi:D-alanyl-D-alanine carboxypeptidase
MSKTQNILYLSILFILVLHITGSVSKDTRILSGNPQIDDKVLSFMNRYKIPGMSLAVAKNGKLVYSKGYGYANISKKEKTTTKHIFRIASVSKSITSIAIMKLIEDGQISLKDYVFGDGGLLEEYYTDKLPPYVDEIQLKHLLEHSAGGWGNNLNDPMFNNNHLDKDQLIIHTLKNQRLTNRPGTKYLYSNFGYFLLGRVIERVSGLPYEEYVRKVILNPLNIQSAYVGWNTAEEKLDHEVSYYSEDNLQYKMNVNRMDSNGGWVMSAKDMLKLLVSVDGFASKPDILLSETIKMMTKPSSTNPNYAFGWAVNKNGNWWHVGGLPGTASIWVRTHQGYCWVILANSRNSHDLFNSDMDNIMWEVLKSNPKWIDGDLFED